jgi:phosphate-selective porin OprO/OprP
MRTGRHGQRWSIVEPALILILFTVAPAARSQENRPSPSPSSLRQVSPIPTDPRASAPVSIGQLADRLRALEDVNKKLAERLERTTREHDEHMRLNRKLAEQMERNAREHDEQMNLLSARYAELSRRLADGGNGQTRAGDVGGGALAPTDVRPWTDLGSPVPEYWSFQEEPPFPDPRYRLSNINHPEPSPLKARFGPGFQLETEDEEFRLQVHILEQIEGRAWANGRQTPPVSGFFFPRQRFFFNGRITRPIEYVFSINRGLNSLDLLDAFVNIHFDDRFQVRFGRYMTPLTYDQFAIRPMWLPTPERSLFTTNLGLNRQIGLMAWGHLFDHRVDYAAGVFNGSRNSFQSLTNGKDFIAYLNARPFQDSESLWFLKYLNLGSSVAFGHQDQAPVPVALRIGAVSPDAALPGVATVPFLILNQDVIERGDRLLGSVHAAYYFRSLSLLGEWQYGYNSYATPARPSSVAVPVSGYYVTAAYFLTGEHVESRMMLQPRRPLIPTRADQVRGLGAWEAVARVSDLRVGQNVFTAGFADPNLWSSSAVTTELGMNWYWNEHFKIYMFWLHGSFGDPVLFRTGSFQKSADMFWLRCQLWF